MGESRNAYRVLVGRPEGKRPLGKPRRRWEDNINMDLREVGYDDRDWINLAQDRDQWRAYVRAAMNLRFLKSQVNRFNIELYSPQRFNWLFMDASSTIRLFSVKEIRDSQMIFGEMRPIIRHRLSEILLTIEKKKQLGTWGLVSLNVAKRPDFNVNKLPLPAQRYCQVCYKGGSWLEQHIDNIMTTLQSKILECTNLASQIMQSENIELDTACSLIQNAADNLSCYRNNFEEAMSSATSLARSWGIPPQFENKIIRKDQIWSCSTFLQEHWQNIARADNLLVATPADGRDTTLSRQSNEEGVVDTGCFLSTARGREFPYSYTQCDGHLRCGNHSWHKQRGFTAMVTNSTALTKHCVH
ncbi:hypothetical protein ANN_02382 [Periplaneta americana]|uniref:Uncharacterized protein n=1 Tax=Periplaneta americana TaxID=6978 RepID=A0ABQ8TZ43_PERAM|nr:hypothetical protein ANN_02382 [Periplaneta americana]